MLISFCNAQKSNISSPIHHLDESFDKYSNNYIQLIFFLMEGFNSLPRRALHPIV